MCIRITFTNRSALTYRTYEASTQVITLPSSLPDEVVEIAVRAVLDKLAVPQALAGARCHCGAAIRLLPRIPEQRRSAQVSHHGA
ncbi:hypothetical protein [Streptomyces sp. NPDC056401]|uniref:hypothetical protein n=1 Tax=Streptomyces sp. NPDC056401 TaxID=3345809 RepID=UPI0035D85D8B